MGSWKRFWVSPFSLKLSTFFLFSSQFQWYDWIPRQRFPLWSTLSLCYNWINLLTSKFSSLVHTLLLSFLIVRLGLSAAICKHNKRVSDGGSQPKSIWKTAVTRQRFPLWSILSLGPIVVATKGQKAKQSTHKRKRRRCKNCKSFGHDRRKCTKVCTDAYETHNYDHVGAPNNVENVNLNLIGSSDGLLQSDSQHGCNKELMDSNWFQIIPPGQWMNQISAKTIKEFYSWESTNVFARLCSKLLGWFKFLRSLLGKKFGDQISDIVSIQVLLGL